MIIGLVGIFGAVSSALALSYTTTSSDKGPGAGITYTLDYVSNGGQDYSAQFKITETLGAGLPFWSVGWVIFKLDGSGPIPISSSSLTAPPASGPWEVADGSNNVNVNVLAGAGKYPPPSTE